MCLFRRPCILIAALTFLFVSGCTTSSHKVPKATSSVSPAPVSSFSSESESSSSSAVSVSSKPTAPAPVSDAVGLSAFYPLKKNAAATLYCNLTAGTGSRVIRGSYDLNGDGKSDAVTLDFASAPDTGKKSTLTIGGTQVYLSLCGIAGIYAVSLDGSDRELALVDYEMDNYVSTYFFSFSGKSLTQLGQVQGGIEPDSREGYNIPEYNFQILSDGHGRMIPRFGVMRYVSPNIMLSAEKFDGRTFSNLSIRPTAAGSRTYTLAMDISPYFQGGSTDVSKPDLRCDDKDKIRLPKGQAITLLSVNPSVADLACAGVRLSNGKKGLLYFFLHP